MTNKNKKAVILLSGGLDSATTLYIAKDAGFNCYALSFRYGQRHAIEISSAKKVAASANVVEHRIIDIDLAAFGASALTDNIEVPKDRPEIGENTDIPITYVPARNTIFLSYALAFAEVIGAFDIFIGVNAADYSGYPDCRPEFIKAFQTTANLATAAAIKQPDKFVIQVPIIDMTKAQIIQQGLKLGLDYALTHSCYDPDDQNRACGHCDSCKLRLKGFKEAHAIDPIIYREHIL